MKGSVEVVAAVLTYVTAVAIFRLKEKAVM